MKVNWIICVFLQLFCSGLIGEENFILINGKSNEKIFEMGPNLNERLTPCSSFKIALSLIGFDAAILVNESAPVWLFQEGYDDFLVSWKNPQTPESWIKASCVWYSRLLATSLGKERCQDYLKAMEYGNQDISGGLDCFWLSSSLKISPVEQAEFIWKMLANQLPISSYAIQMTKKLLFIDELSGGWKLFGKTGWSGRLNKPDDKNELGWFVGWIEKDTVFLPFAYNIRGAKIDLAQRIPRVKQLLADSLISEGIVVVKHQFIMMPR